MALPLLSLTKKACGRLGRPYSTYPQNKGTASAISSWLLLSLVPVSYNQVKDLEGFLHPVVDELKMMHNEGFRVVDRSAGQKPFFCRVRVLQVILDHQGSVKVSGGDDAHQN